MRKHIFALTALALAFSLRASAQSFLENSQVNGSFHTDAQYYMLDQGIDINDLKGNVITFTYSYQLSKHTRLKVGYQNAKVKASNMPDQKVDFYFTELFSKF